MRSIDVNEAIDQGPFGRFQWMVVALCGTLLIVDGYDVFVAGTVLPTLIAEWGLTKPQAGALQAWALFGMMFGALILGSLADRIGRKKGVAISFVLFTSATLVTGFANSPEQFKIFRFIAGLGCGGLMPNAVALMNEYAPRRMRGTMVALMFSGYSVGGMVAAGLGIGLIPGFGWKPMFYIAAVPLMLLPLILWKLPESLGFLIRQGRQDEARRIFAKVSGAPLAAGDKLVFSESKGASASVAELFRHGRALRTLMLWLSFFCCLLLVYLLSSWLPKVLQEAGYAERASLLSLFSLNFGGMAGAIAGGWMGDRYGLPKVVVGFFAAAAVSIALIGANPAAGLLFALVFVAGATTIGTQILLYASVAQLYNLSVRSTGLGWASGVGRIGAIVGPTLGGVLLARELPLGQNFLIFAIPAAVSALAMLVFALSNRRTHDTGRLAAA
ncbi:MFS transporter, AAHS family, benzoate transport protein [Paracoccus halophilus]|uniref:MFS transporter, AAHS family, benzoate transport protein n=1 Tax=Paracoccus halophilus TaxID=376733 RepID=A0A099F5F5_9RHOB|nr:aromatic acid/H+ symport family MFS transporter [Paracoccus halophilus]KGJ05446.1 major facilitator transporter [Paracoccus halophilus]SFA49300.1 MFS transporter, AAHS family, benzoate transport protein [Paracoccus halophilus]